MEFGLILEDDALRIYGAGILSGPTETVFSLEGRSPNRIHLAVDRVMRTDYTISDLQATYFVIESFRELFHLTEQRGFEPIYESLAPAFQFAKTAALDTDHIYHRGTQEYELRGGRGSGRAAGVEPLRIGSPVAMAFTAKTTTAAEVCPSAAMIVCVSVCRRRRALPRANQFRLAPRCDRRDQQAQSGQRHGAGAVVDDEQRAVRSRVVNGPDRPARESVCGTTTAGAVSEAPDNG